jgi:hypothetical protein
VSCEDQGFDCGITGDGCGGTLDCGACTGGETCGGGGEANVCGRPSCTPWTCASLAFDCGMASDGCNGTVSCGTCPAGENCGADLPDVCGPTTCTPRTCQDQGFDCGMAGDTCGNLLSCGTCAGNVSCGGGGTPNVCGTTCVPATCATLGADCGAVADGCGGLLACGTCAANQTCGALTANVCGYSTPCTGLCLQQTSCAGTATTSISGTVYAPNGVDPLVNVLVYVPNGPVLPFAPGVSCDNCSSSVSGAPLVSAITAVDGTFTISDMPVGTGIPLVIQNGRWRRQVVVPSVAACVDTPVAASLTRFPRNKSEGDIPLMAFSTGTVDSLECVMLKIGIDAAEVTAPGGTGRIQLYVGLDDPDSYAMGGAGAPGSPLESELWSTQAALDQYDMVLFPCQGDQTTRSAAVQQNLIEYANAGGRIFATHFSYVWLYDDAPFSGTADWVVNQMTAISPDPQTAYINTAFPKGLALAQWLQVLYPSSALGQVQINTLRHDFDGVVAPSTLWVSIDDPTYGVLPMHYSFNTPIAAPAAQQCGRVLFNDYHVENSELNQTNGDIFPAECLGGPMTQQEKMLEFMLFDLGSCIVPDQPTCVPKTCAAQSIQCGPAGDGCGGVLSCGTCPAGQTCGGGAVLSQCGAPSCTPKTCASQGYACGAQGDGCGGILQCGTCTSGTCGGGGPGACGTGICAPKTCAAQGADCGPVGDGCGDILPCGTCTAAGQSCGGGGTPGVCGAPSCTPETCAELGADCGAVADGCGQILQCGTCPLPQICGGGTPAKPNVCGGGQGS